MTKVGDHQLRVDMEEHVDIKFSAHGAFLEYPSSGTLNTERLESLMGLGARKPEGLNKRANMG
jgi:hypothetical protein